MNKDRIVKIDLAPEAGPPLQHRRAKNGRPAANCFRFAPRGFGHLDERVSAVTWDSVGKTLHVAIGETARFEAAKWLNYMDHQYHQYQKSPFVDVDDNVVVLDALDADGRKVATLRFKNLKVERHECRFERGDPAALWHDVTISYQTAEMAVHADQSAGVENGDDEWQTVATPA